MRSASRRPGAAATLLSLLLAGLPASIFPAQEPAPPPPAAPAAPSAPQEAPRSLTVYFPEDEDAASAPAPAPPAPVQPASPWTAAGLGLLLVAAVLAWMRLRAPLCPRCRTKMSVLEPEEGTGGRPHLEVLACQGCDEVRRRKYKLFLTQDRRCPACATAAKVSRLVPIDRPGYLTWGRMRVDDECARCDYRASSFYAAPLLEAPPRQRPRRSQAV
jgi:hypothetical protein